MTDLRTCTKAGLGFAIVAGLSASVTLGQGSDLPDGSPCSVIGALPFASTGTTTGLDCNGNGIFDDFDAVCPFSGSTSPDVFYSYQAAAGVEGISVNICESGYDTKLFILDGSFNEVACNDDGCSDSNGNAFRSIIDCLAVNEGETYYIAIDGWSGDAGSYDMVADACTPPEPCIFEEGDCTGTPEGEPCVDGQIDVTNGGCNSTPAVYSFVACGDTVCGTTWAAGGTRDTDWYSLTQVWADGTGEITHTAVAECELVHGYIAGCPDGAPSCACVTAIDPFIVGAPCVETSVTRTIGDGESWWFCGHTQFDLLFCGQEEPGNDYITSWTCNEDPPPPPCCNLGDSNEDGFVDFDDLLTVLANWGPCPF